MQPGIPGLLFDPAVDFSFSNAIGRVSGSNQRGRSASACACAVPSREAACTRKRVAYTSSKLRYRPVRDRHPVQAETNMPEFWMQEPRNAFPQRVRLALIPSKSFLIRQKPFLNKQAANNSFDRLLCVKAWCAQVGEAFRTRLFSPCADHPGLRWTAALIRRRIREALPGLPAADHLPCPLRDFRLPLRGGAAAMARSPTGAHPASRRPSRQPRAADDLGGIRCLARRPTRSGRPAHRLRHRPSQRLERDRPGPRRTALLARSAYSRPLSGSPGHGRANLSCVHHPCRPPVSSWALNSS